MTTHLPGHLLHVFATFDVGGPQVRSCHLFNHFGAKYRHTVIAMNGNYASKSRVSPDLSVDFVSLDFEKKETLRNIVLFRKTLQAKQPDVLVTYNWGTIEWVMGNSLWPICPHIHLEEGFRPDEAHSQKWSRILTRRIFLTRIFKLVIPSLLLKNIALESWKLKASRVEYIPNGIDCHRFLPHATRPNASSQAPLIISTVAGLRKVKNLPRLIRVFANLPKGGPACELRIAGNGPEYETLQEMIISQKLSDRVRLLGHMDDPSEMLQHTDIFAISSDTEQMPTSVIEAMASGLPVVGTHVGDIQHMVGPSNKAYIVEPSDEDGFVRCLEKLIEHPELRQTLGDENRQKCLQEFSHSVMFERYSQLFDSAIQLQRGRNRDH
jgi:glycosyltransferase involved in cell wall biosynthesis